MPYINPASRDNAEINPITPGELNFAITRLLVRYLLAAGKSYTTFNDCMGVLEGAKMELYRREIAPYEDVKRVENGDVYFL